MSVWSWLKDKRPVDISLKKRTEGSVTIAYGKELDMCYLNRVASDFLALSDGTNTVDDIARQLLALYSVKEEELRSDLVDLARSLQWQRLIRLEG